MNNQANGQAVSLDYEQQLAYQKEQQKYYARSHSLDIAVKLNINSVNKDADSIIAEAKKIENYLLNG